MRSSRSALSALVATLLLCAACEQPVEEEEAVFLPDFDKIDLFIENGSVFDGYGNPPVRANVVIVGDRIVFVGETDFTEADLANRVANRIDAYDKAVTPRIH